MDHIVAVEVTTDIGHRTYFLTWGRIQDRVDPAPLEEVIMSVVGKFSTAGTPLAARVCDTLQEASGAPFFYESFFGFCQKRIPVGDEYEEWRQQMDARMRDGYEIASLGPQP